MKNRKLLYAVLFTAVFLLVGIGIGIGASASTHWKVVINDKPFAQAKMIEGKVYVPLDSFATRLGASVSYDKKTKTYSVRSQISAVPIKPFNTPTVTTRVTSTVTSTVTPNIVPTIPPSIIPTLAQTIAPITTGTSDTVSSQIYDANLATVLRVVDGDTIIVDWNGKEERVRMIGVDTPETVDPDQPVQPYGKEASDYTKSKLSAQKIRLELDLDPRDRYGRLLAYVWLNDQLFNADLIRNGYAILLTISPNVKYVHLFTEEQQKARDAQRGLWANSIVTPHPMLTNQTSPSPTKQPTVTSGISTERPAISSTKINVNTATQSELESIPGIGPTLASRIIEYRNTKPFLTTRDLIEVKGIGEATYQKMAPFVRVD